MGAATKAWAEMKGRGLAGRLSSNHDLAKAATAAEDHARDMSFSAPGGRNSSDGRNITHKQAANAHRDAAKAYMDKARQVEKNGLYASSDRDRAKAHITGASEHD